MKHRLELWIFSLLLMLSGCRGGMTVIEYGEPTPTPIPSISASPSPR